MRNLVLAGLLCSTTITSVALAQVKPAEPVDTAQSGQIADIVVTAQRRSESLQRVPLAVTAFDARALEARGLTNLNNLSTSVSPGVSITQFAGTPSTLALNIRGAYSSDPGIGLVEQGVAVYADGVPLGRAQGVGIELGDIERIELLRGPQGTLFGRNAEGGAVQFVTKRPTGKAGGRVELGGGNFDQRRALAIVELPSFGNISIKLSGLIDKHDGWTKNLQPRPGVDLVTPGFRLPSASFKQERSGSFEDPGLKDQRGFRIAALWAPSPKFSAYYTYDFSDLDYTVSYNSRTGGRVPSSYAWCLNPAYAATCATPGSIAANVYTGTPTAQPGNPKFADVPLFLPQSSQHVRGHGLTLEWHPSDAITLKSITGLRFLVAHGNTNLGTSQVFVQTVPTSAFGANIGQLAGYSGSINPAEVDQKQFSQEVQMIGDFKDLKLTAGLFYFRERVFDSQTSLFGLGYQIISPTVARPIAIDPFDFDGTGADGLPGSFQKYEGVAHSYAAYAQATYTPSSILDGDLSLTAGLRYTNDKKVFDRLRAAAGSLPGASATFKQDRVDPAFTLAYQVTPNINTYARYARAYRAGGTGIRNKLALTTYQAEVNTSYELGLKTLLFDNHLRLNIAAFHSTIKDPQVSFQNSTLDPASTDTVNATGNVKIKGIEVESQLQLTRELSANLGYSYMKGSVSGSATGLVTIGPGTTMTESRPLVYNPYLPKHQINVGVDYARPFANAEFFMHGEYNYVSGQYNSPFITTGQQEETSGLSQFNARVGIRAIDLGMAHLSVELWSNNLFNKNDRSYCFAISSSDFTADATPGGSCYYYPPRTYGVTTKVRF